MIYCVGFTPYNSDAITHQHCADDLFIIIGNLKFYKKDLLFQPGNSFCLSHQLTLNFNECINEYIQVYNATEIFMFIFLANPWELRIIIHTSGRDLPFRFSLARYSKAEPDPAQDDPFLIYRFIVCIIQHTPVLHSSFFSAVDNVFIFYYAVCVYKAAGTALHFLFLWLYCSIGQPHKYMSTRMA